MTAKPIKPGLLTLICILAILNQNARAQTLWIESGFKNYRYCNQAMMYQTSDTLYWYSSGMEAASNMLLYKIDYFIRGDSLFQKPLSKEALYTLSSNPETLPDSLKGPFFLGVFGSDSLVLKFKPRGKYPRVFKKSSPTHLSTAEKKRLNDLMNNYVLEADVNALTGRKGKELQEIKYLTNVKARPSDPYYSPNGIYAISKQPFLLIPAADQKFFQIISVSKNNILVESVCGKRKQIQLEKSVSKK